MARDRQIQILMLKDNNMTHISSDILPVVTRLLSNSLIKSRKTVQIQSQNRHYKLAIRNIPKCYEKNKPCQTWSAIIMAISVCQKIIHKVSINSLVYFAKHMVLWRHIIHAVKFHTHKLRFVKE